MAAMGKHVGACLAVSKLTYAIKIIKTQWKALYELYPMSLEPAKIRIKIFSNVFFLFLVLSF